MRIRDSLFIIFSLTLLTFAVSYKLDVNRLENKNLNLQKSQRTLSQEFKNYKSEEIQKKLVQEKKRADEETKRAKEEKKRGEEKKKIFSLKQKQLCTQKIKQLKTKVERAFEAAQKIYSKYKKGKCRKRIIKEVLNQHLVFIKDYEGNSVGAVQAQELQVKKRAIGLEEIQKVRRHQEGFIKIHSTNITQTIYVKDLHMYDWFIGSSTTAKLLNDRTRSY